jgi:hypothetical protein
MRNEAMNTEAPKLLVRILYAKTATKRFKFVVTFDEYNVIDTIEQVDLNTNGRKLLVSTNKYAKAILHNADKVEAGYIAPVGFTWK